MSLIQEALKRQQQEFGGGDAQETPSQAGSEPPVTETMPVMAQPSSSTPAVSLPPPASPALPSASLPPPPPRRSSHSLPKIGGIVAAALVLLLVGGLISAKWIFKWTQAKNSVVAAVQPAVPAPATAEAVVIPEAPVVAGALPAGQAEVTQDASPPDQAAEEKPPPAKERPAPVQWPAVKLSGVCASPNPGEGSARINNQIVFVGGEISGVTLVEIRGDGVMLKYKTETKFLKMGGMLY